MVLFLEYPKCTTCQKAKRWLNENNVEFDDRHIVENNPSTSSVTVHEYMIWHYHK